MTGGSLEKIHMSLSTAPALILYQGDLARAAQRGTILFYHGLGSCKESQEKEIVSLAKHGFLSIAIDNIGHGERRYRDFEQRFSSKNPDLEADLTKAVQETAQEVPDVVQAIIDKGLAHPQKIGICGISMGGYIVYASLLQERRIQAAVSILGSPKWKVHASQSPCHFPDCFFPVAFLAMNAGADRSVPPQSAREFHERLKPFYSSSPEKLCYREYPGADHFMPEKDWNDLWEKTLQWFDRFLVS